MPVLVIINTSGGDSSVMGGVLSLAGADNLPVAAVVGRVIRARLRGRIGGLHLDDLRSLRHLAQPQIVVADRLRVSI